MAQAKSTSALARLSASTKRKRTKVTSIKADSTDAEPKVKGTKRTAKKQSTDTTGLITAAEFFATGELHGDRLVNVDGEVLKFTNLHKLYWPKEKYTKGDLLKYYFAVGSTMLPYLKDRPEIMRRFPNGINGPFFYQHNLEDAPGFIRTHTIRSSDGTDVRYVLVDSMAALLYITNLGAIAQNPFHSHLPDLSQPDYFVLDLDPEKGATFKTVCTVALEVQKILKELKLLGYPKTSGSTGLHIYIPIKSGYTYDDVVRVGRAIATRVAERNPAIATVERMTRNRKRGQVYVDFLQNIEGKTIAAVYSAREKPGATVSAPVDWAEIKKGIDLLDFTIMTMPARLKKKGDLFQDVLKKRQALPSVAHLST